MLMIGQCDERTPTCNNCLKHRIDCVYLMSPVKSRLLQSAGKSADVPTSATAHVESDHSSHAPSPITPSIPGYSDPSQAYNSSYRDTGLSSNLHMRDLELMHHYSTVCYKTISEDEDFCVTLQNDVPKSAVAHPFLMHGILSLSALHLVRARRQSESCREYVELATGHQALALMLFRRELNNINPSNSPAMFAFSIIASVLAFGFAQASELRSLPPVDEMLQILNLCRGIQKILETTMEWIKDSWVMQLLGIKKADDLRPLPPDMQAKMTALSELNADTKRTGFSPEETKAHEEAISQLSETFEYYCSGCDRIKLFRWPVIVNSTYVACLGDRRPMSLVILAHYCILLYSMDNRWWLEGWSRQLLAAIYDILDFSWREHIKWPLERVGLGEPR